MTEDIRIDLTIQIVGIYKTHFSTQQSVSLDMIIGIVDYKPKDFIEFSTLFCRRVEALLIDSSIDIPFLLIE